MEQVKLKIVSGAWRSGQALPSIRELAASSAVSVITVKRAYQELERQGVIVTRQGKGSFVAMNEDMQEALKWAEINKFTDELINAADRANVSTADLSAYIQVALAKRK